MALKDKLFGFFDNVGLSEVFHKKQPDVKSLRAPLLKGIDNARRQFEQGQTKAPNRWWKVSNGVVALTVRMKGDVFDINGVASNHMPQERFPEFLTKFKEAVAAGEFDSELINKGEGNAQVHITRSPRAPRASGPRGTGPGSRAQPDNPEWMSAFTARHGPAPEGHVPNAKGTRWVSAANANRGMAASKKRYG